MPRYISEDLKNRILKTRRTKAENAAPELEIIVSRPRYSVTDTSRFQVDTIREKTGLGDIGLDLKREDEDSSPTMLYEVHNDNGEIWTATRTLPALPENEWIDGIKIADGNLCRLVFNGRWQWSEKHEKYSLVTEDDPFLFFTNTSDVLYVQDWEDDTGRQQLATDVQALEVFRGWRSNTSLEADQGIIAAYIKSDGYLYYRNYTWNATNSQYEWEGEARILFSEVPEIKTLYLGGATGGTYTLGTSTLNYNDNAAIIQTALESEYGSGLVTVETGTDFIITFDTSEGTSGLTADFTGLTGATSPSLTITQAYADQEGNATKVSIFRTNDYRTGFIVTTDNDEVYWTITNRQWAGLAIRAEAINGSLTGIEITRTQIIFIKNYPAEAIGCSLSGISASRLYGISPQMEAAENQDDGTGDYGFKIQIEFDEDIYDITGNYGKFSIIDGNSSSYPPTAIAYVTGRTDAVILTCTDFNAAYGTDITITYTSATGGLTGEAGQELDTQTLTFTPSNLVAPIIPAPVATSAENIEGEEVF